MPTLAEAARSSDDVRTEAGRAGARSAAGSEAAAVRIPFEWVRVFDDRCKLSGHGALDPTARPPLRLVGSPAEVSLEEAQASARMAGLSMLSGLRRAIGTIDRVQVWLVANAFVNAEAGYPQTTAVVSPISDLIIEVFGPEVGAHARTAVGVNALPLNRPSLRRQSS